MLRSVYHGDDKTIQETADHFGVSWATIWRWLKRLDIPTRERRPGVGFSTTRDKGYEKWHHNGQRVYVHRLLAVAEYGFDTVCDNVVHHKNGIPWDNRLENIEALPQPEHHGEHTKVPEIERKAIAYAYEFTDMSSYDIAETCDYTPNSVIRIWREYFS